MFAGLAVWDEKAGEQRIEQRKALREAQIRVGDRELFVNDQVRETWKGCGLHTVE